MKVAFALVMTSLLGAGDLRRVDDHAGHAADHAVAVGLPTLTASTSTSPEVRVWREVALDDALTGWVIRPGSIETYSPSGQVAAVHTPHADDVLAAFQALRAQGDSWIACRAKDGWSLTVEGTDALGYFVVRALNPNACHEPGPVAVWQAYRLLLEVAGEAP